MKFDRNPERQTQRIDQRKANRIRRVKEAPQHGINGDLIAIGNEDEITDILLRETDKWTSLFGQINTAVGTVNTQITDMQAAILKLQDKIKDIDDIKEDIKNINEDIKNINEKNGNIGDINDDIKNINADIADHERRLQNLENKQ